MEQNRVAIVADIGGELVISAEKVEEVSQTLANLVDLRLASFVETTRLELERLWIRLGDVVECSDLERGRDSAMGNVLRELDEACQRLRSKRHECRWQLYDLLDDAFKGVDKIVAAGLFKIEQDFSEALGVDTRGENGPSASSPSSPGSLTGSEASA
jgi:hypothetical protein